MAGSIVTQRTQYKPLVLVDTANLSREEWLSYRRRGIGGSDVASIFGVSPFRTARELYYDKLNIVSVEEDEGNWVAMEMGNLLEPLVAKIFGKRQDISSTRLKRCFTIHITLHVGRFGLFRDDAGWHHCHSGNQDHELQCQG